jgi:hypothetical protein
MPIHWGVHSSHSRWLDNFFWIYQGAMFTCCYVFDFKIWTLILESRIDECHMHHISSLLVESSCWGNFMDHLVSLKVHLCFEKVIGLAFDQVKILALLWKQTWSWNIFFLIMQNNHAIALKLPILCNLVTWLWFKFASNALEDRLSKYFVLIELSVVMILGGIKDKCCFSTLSIQVSK